MKRTLGLTLACFVLLAASCRYEDGPWITITAKDHRLSRTWELVEAFDDQGNPTQDMDYIKFLMFTINGYVDMVATHDPRGSSYIGAWEMDENGDSIRMVLEESFTQSYWFRRDYEITRLTESDLWVRSFEDPGTGVEKLYEIRFFSEDD